MVNHPNSEWAFTENASKTACARCDTDAAFNRAARSFLFFDNWREFCESAVHCIRFQACYGAIYLGCWAFGSMRWTIFHQGAYCIDWEQQLGLLRSVVAWMFLLELLESVVFQGRACKKKLF
uniref:Uncharacterized protein n=1 Tax=Octactis speculum TaxID=3111310 RepID=A0A7S2GB22_9STRA